MTGWTRHTGRAVTLPLDSIDTDQLIPARFMSAPRSEGYARFLLHDLRHRADGTPDPAFPLNAVPSASILVAGRNFGAGSSREAAVYALVDAGFRAVLAPSFGDIFAANAVNNGLLPGRVPEGTSLDGTHTIDLETCTIDGSLAFELDPVWRTKLVNGWDDIDLTAAHADTIAAFAREDAARRPWARPPTDTSQGARP
jgi:3-isopropylmalate/(R)-2-methylmalate dehydratase small subunit